MDESAYKDTYREFNANACAFEKAVLTNQCRCSRVEKLCLAEREAAHCDDVSARDQCKELLEILNQHARFALKGTEDFHQLPHGKKIKIQVGGMRGLHIALEPTDEAPLVVEDVYGLICRAKEKFGNFERLPFQTIMQQISAYKAKVRSKRR